MSPGKLAAQVGHCAEAYWTGMFRPTYRAEGDEFAAFAYISEDVFKEYIHGTATIAIFKNINNIPWKRTSEVRQIEK